MEKDRFLLLLSSFLFAFPGFWSLLILLNSYFEYDVIPLAIEILLVPAFLFIIVLLAYFLSKNINAVKALVALQIAASLFVTVVLFSMALPTAPLNPTPRCEVTCAVLTAQGDSACVNAKLSEDCSGQCVMERADWGDYICKYKEQPKPDYDWLLLFLLFWGPFIAGVVTLFITVTRYSKK